jgi:hypothetical protein
LAVEHIQPKDPALYPHLAGRWDNFLLGCVNCNSTKSNKDVHLDHVLLPDRDNTAAAFNYTPDGRIEVALGLSLAQKEMARTTLSLPGLDKRISEVHDANGQLVALDRVTQRMEVWAIAEESKQDLVANPHDAMRRQIGKTAAGHGCFSIWMTVFSNDPAMRNLFISEFRGTSRECYDSVTTALVTPRPPEMGLAHAGKT